MTTQTNAAAERLLEYLEEQDGSVDVAISRQVDAALAEERRAYRDRVKARLIARQGSIGWEAMAHYFDVEDR